MFTRVLVIIGLVIIAPVTSRAEQYPRQIVVTGTGEVTAEPDMATIRLGVTHEDREAKRAMDRVSQDIRALLEKLAEFGLEPRSVQTSTLRLDPVWDNSSRSQYNGQARIAGFVARNELTLKLYDFPRLGELLDLMLRDGANHFSGVTFGVRETMPLLDGARKRAVSDAKRKAELYAEAAGVALGAVEEIREPGASAGPGPRSTRMEMAVADAGMPVAGGELTFAARITIVYAIAE